MTRVRRNRRFEHVYAILRIDRGIDGIMPSIDNVIVTKVFREIEEAEKEVARLNSIGNSDKCAYHMQITRITREPDQASPTTTASPEAP